MNVYAKFHLNLWRNAEVVASQVLGEQTCQPTTCQTDRLTHIIPLSNFICGGFNDRTGTHYNAK